jgi:hypothetical protein
MHKLQGSLSLVPAEALERGFRLLMLRQVHAAGDDMELQEEYEGFLRSLARR